MPDRVISKTSPLFYLHRLRHLDLLQKLYQQIIVPEAVVDDRRVISQRWRLYSTGCFNETFGSVTR